VVKGGNLRNSSYLRQPKVYNPPKEKLPLIWPKFIKLSIICFILVGGLIYFVGFSSFFKINAVEIKGTSSDEIKQITESYKTKNIFFTDFKPLEKDLILAKPEFFSVRVYRGIPNILRVEFAERKPKLIWSTQNRQYLVDENSILFKESTSEGNLPLVKDLKNLPVTIPSQIASASFVTFLKSTQSELNNRKFEFDYFEVNETTFQVSAVLKNGIRIMFDTTRSLSYQLEALEKVYSDNKDKIKQYIDVRVDGWAYFM